MALTDSTPTDAVIQTGSEFEDAVQNTVKLLDAFKSNYKVGVIYDYDIIQMPSSLPTLAVTYVSSTVNRRTLGKQGVRETWDHTLNIWYYYANVESSYRESELRRATGEVTEILIKYPTVNGFNNHEPAQVINVSVLERPLLDGDVAASRIVYLIHRDLHINFPITTQGIAKYL